MRGLTRTCILSLLSNKICSCRLTRFFFLHSNLPGYVRRDDEEEGGAERRLAAFVLSRIDVNVFYF